MGLVCPSSDLKTCLFKSISHFLPPPHTLLRLLSFLACLDLVPSSFFPLITPPCDLIWAV